jgi:hypothetical protein
MKTTAPTFDLHTVYRTEQGREALVVFGGDEHAPDKDLRPLRALDGGVRIAYLLPDGTEADLLMTEYDWYTGTLTPVRDLADTTGTGEGDNR